MARVWDQRSVPISASADPDDEHWFRSRSQMRLFGVIELSPSHGLIAARGVESHSRVKSHSTPTRQVTNRVFCQGDVHRTWPASSPSTCLLPLRPARVHGGPTGLAQYPIPRPLIAWRKANAPTLGTHRRDLRAFLSMIDVEMRTDTPCAAFASRLHCRSRLPTLC